MRGFIRKRGFQPTRSRRPGFRSGSLTQTRMAQLMGTLPLVNHTYCVYRNVHCYKIPSLLTRYRLRAMLRMPRIVFFRWGWD